MDPADVLLVVLQDEVQRRTHQRVANRLVKAKLDPTKVFDEWHASANVTYNSRLLDELRTLKFVNEKQHVLIMGPVGVGKTMVAQAGTNPAPYKYDSARNGPVFLFWGRGARAQA